MAQEASEQGLYLREVRGYMLTPKNDMKNGRFCDTLDSVKSFLRTNQGADHDSGR